MSMTDHVCTDSSDRYDSDYSNQYDTEYTYSSDDQSDNGPQTEVQEPAHSYVVPIFPDMDMEEVPCSGFEINFDDLDRLNDLFQMWRDENEGISIREEDYEDYFEDCMQHTIDENGDICFPVMVIDPETDTLMAEKEYAEKQKAAKETPTQWRRGSFSQKKYSSAPVNQKWGHSGYEELLSEKDDSRWPKGNQMHKFHSSAKSSYGSNWSRSRDHGRPYDSNDSRSKTFSRSPRSSLSTSSGGYQSAWATVTPDKLLDYSHSNFISPTAPKDTVPAESVAVQPSCFSASVSVPANANAGPTYVAPTNAAPAIIVPKQPAPVTALTSPKDDSLEWDIDATVDWATDLFEQEAAPKAIKIRDSDDVFVIKDLQDGTHPLETLDEGEQNTKYAISAGIVDEDEAAVKQDYEELSQEAKGSSAWRGFASSCQSTAQPNLDTQLPETRRSSQSSFKWSSDNASRRGSEKSILARQSNQGSKPPRPSTTQPENARRDSQSSFKWSSGNVSRRDSSGSVQTRQSHTPSRSPPRPAPSSSAWNAFALQESMASGILAHVSPKRPPSSQGKQGYNRTTSRSSNQSWGSRTPVTDRRRATDTVSPHITNTATNDKQGQPSWNNHGNTWESKKDQTSIASNPTWNNCSELKQGTPSDEKQYECASNGSSDSWPMTKERRHDHGAWEEDYGASDTWKQESVNTSAWQLGEPSHVHDRQQQEVNNDTRQQTQHINNKNIWQQAQETSNYTLRQETNNNDTNNAWSNSYTDDHWSKPQQASRNESSKNYVRETQATIEEAWSEDKTEASHENVGSSWTRDSEGGWKGSQSPIHQDSWRHRSGSRRNSHWRSRSSREQISNYNDIYNNDPTQDTWVKQSNESFHKPRHDTSWTDYAKPSLPTVEPATREESNWIEQQATISQEKKPLTLTRGYLNRKIAEEKSTERIEERSPSVHHDDSDVEVILDDENHSDWIENNTILGIQPPETARPQTSTRKKNTNPYGYGQYMPMLYPSPGPNGIDMMYMPVMHYGPNGQPMYAMPYPYYPPTNIPEDNREGGSSNAYQANGMMYYGMYPPMYCYPQAREEGWGPSK
ncbi:hypothetical protein BCV72DRAFT_67443 [Rhizopus microsporus var. microsporus]|uniref:Uncharacterized protein n=1 Tax=Rhizopus microsporus var. microsporus TaxID=86635 RepID=A0A1X0QPS4_RHIZD|nr:hypothetical protein BCV72DRAFT_67443 [Rhizopus microsporus var. microsporus]